jgi:hypothetical protein
MSDVLYRYARRLAPSERAEVLDGVTPIGTQPTMVNRSDGSVVGLSTMDDLMTSFGGLRRGCTTHCIYRERLQRIKESGFGWRFGTPPIQRGGGETPTTRLPRIGGSAPLTSRSLRAYGGVPNCFGTELITSQLNVHLSAKT